MNVLGRIVLNSRNCIRYKDGVFFVRCRRTSIHNNFHAKALKLKDLLYVSNPVTIALYNVAKKKHDK